MCVCSEGRKLCEEKSFSNAKAKTQTFFCCGGYTALNPEGAKRRGMNLPYTYYIITHYISDTNLIIFPSISSAKHKGFSTVIFFFFAFSFSPNYLSPSQVVRTTLQTPTVQHLDTSNMKEMCLRSHNYKYNRSVKMIEFLPKSTKEDCPTILACGGLTGMTSALVKFPSW